MRLDSDTLLVQRQSELIGSGPSFCVGLFHWEHQQIRAFLASSTNDVHFFFTPSKKYSFLVPASHYRKVAEKATSLAKQNKGRVVVWASREWPGLAETCAAAAVPLVRIEDGFIRSAGLGALYHPTCSLVHDTGGIYYDPESDSDLTRILETVDFSPGLLARAARLRESIVQRSITKYNIHTVTPQNWLFPEGKKVLLVPGQVENDASLRKGGYDIDSNLALLRKVRETRPDDFILYKPHPDIEAAGRPGRISRAEALRYADQIASNIDLLSLFELVDEVHVLTSQAGFEALLRGKPVFCYGGSFYAGWGLTTDRLTFPKRTRRLSLDELVAGALILYPSYYDWNNQTPCTPEDIVYQLSQPALVKDRRPLLTRLKKRVVTNVIRRFFRFLI